MKVFLNNEPIIVNDLMIIVCAGSGLYNGLTRGL